jgi:hypothetical protein
LGAALASIGIAKDSIIEYETALKTDKFLLIVHGTTDEIARAHAVISEDGYHASYTVHGEAVMIR